MNAVSSGPSAAVLLLVLLPIGILGIAQLVCFLLVVAEMFRRGESGMGLACIFLCLLAGLGSLFAYIYGWVKSSQWGIRRLMLMWTGCLVADVAVAIVVGLATLGFAPQSTEVGLQLGQPSMSYACLAQPKVLQAL